MESIFDQLIAKCLQILGLILFHDMLEKNVSFKASKLVCKQEFFVCRNVDKNANGAIDFNEFIEMMLKQGKFHEKLLISPIDRILKLSGIKA